MNRPAVWTVLLAVAVLGIAAFATWRTDTGTELPRDGAATDLPADPGAQPATAATSSDPIRDAAIPAQNAPVAERLAAYPQGLRGRVIDDRNRPLAGVRVYLLESASNEPLTLPILLQQGLILGPMAETLSTTDGAFALGLQLATDKLYEVRLLSPLHADVRLGDLRVLADEWHDVGDVVMVPGTTIRGRVTVEGTTTPVPGAIIAVEGGSAFADATMHGIPGRENGLATRAGADGGYLIHHAPARGVVRISAVAPGFARVLKRDIDLSSVETIDVDFDLPSGLALTGQVVDAQHRPIRNARVEAWPQQTSLDACTTRSRADGSFTVVGLRQEPHRLRVEARGYRRFEIADVEAGSRDLRVTLLPKAIVAVVVTAPGGRVLREYRLGLRRWFAGENGRPDQTGRIAETPDVRVRLDARDDAYEFGGGATGTYTVQVLAKGWAKTLSAPFTVAADTDRVDVAVQVTAGATLRGRVVDERQQPLADASVSSQIDGARPDNPVWRMLAATASDRITALTVQTDADGVFVLPQLAYGAYQLQVRHPGACPQFVTGIAITDSVERDLGTIRLDSGALVFGRATVDNRVAGQIKVVLTSVVATDTPPPPNDLGIRLETVTDSKGAFAMPRRVPPGDYELKAAAVDSGNPDGQIFQHLIQMQRSATRMTVLPGQRQVEQHIDIPLQK